MKQYFFILFLISHGIVCSSDNSIIRIPLPYVRLLVELTTPTGTLVFTATDRDNNPIKIVGIGREYFKKDTLHDAIETQLPNYGVNNFKNLQMYTPNTYANYPLPYLALINLSNNPKNTRQTHAFLVKTTNGKFDKLLYADLGKPGYLPLQIIEALRHIRSK